MGWIIVLVIVAFIVYKFNESGKNHWKVTIAQAVLAMPPKLVADTMAPLLYTAMRDRVAIYLRVMANYAVALAKGEQDMEAMRRDARNVLCIIHGDEDLKKMLYDKYGEVVPYLAGEWPVSYERFIEVLKEIRMD